MMRRSLRIVTVNLLTLALVSCGGGGSSAPTTGGGSSGGGGGGGNGAPTMAISQLAPSTVPVESLVGIAMGVMVSGQGFTQQSQVLIDGEPAFTTCFVDSTTLQVEIESSLNASVGTHQFSVQNGSQVSNSLPYTVYEEQQGPFVMQAIPGFLVGREMDAPFIVAADVNGDGLSDVIMPGQGLGNSQSIAILFGQSDGTLSAPQYVPVPLAPYALAVADVDGNGTADLISITASIADSTVTVSTLSGDGHGNFQAPVDQQTFTGTFPGPAYMADLDGDGKPDLLVATIQPFGAAANIVWLKNTGGAFAPPVTLATTATNTNFCIADFNGDGKPDILYVATNSSFHLLLNQGSGQFQDQLAAGLTGVVGNPNCLDFNLDGIPDVVVEVVGNTSGKLVSFAGNGDGSFTKVATLKTPDMAQLVSGDFDHDGFPDLAGSTGLSPSEIVYFFGDGHGNFVAQPVVGPEGEFAAVGDFNGDGIPDVVIPDRFNFVSLVLGRTDRNFPSPLALNPSTMTELSTGDINGDGLPELFVGGDPINGIPGTVFLNKGNSSFQFGANTDPSSFEVADLTGKGVVDLLGGNTNLEIWPNNDTLNFSSSPVTLTQPTSDITVADMDGDGFPDIVSGTGQIFYGNGSYQFTAVTVPGLGSPYLIGDFNGDGKPDVVTSSGTLLNIGGRVFQQVASNNLPLEQGSVMAVGDFNGDGNDDVAISLPGEGTISIYYSNGDGTFSQGAQVDPGQLPQTMVVGDFNGDGKLDLAVGLENSQQVCLLFNNGNGQFTRTFYASGANAVAITASDLNRNGKLDLGIGNFVLDFAPPNVDVMFHK